MRPAPPQRGSPGANPPPRPAPRAAPPPARPRPQVWLRGLRQRAGAFPALLLPPPLPSGAAAPNSASAPPPDHPGKAGQAEPRAECPAPAPGTCGTAARAGGRGPGRHRRPLSPSAKEPGAQRCGARRRPGAPARVPELPWVIPSLPSTYLPALLGAPWDLLGLLVRAHWTGRGSAGRAPSERPAGALWVQQRLPRGRAAGATGLGGEPAGPNARPASGARPSGKAPSSPPPRARKF